MTKRLYSMFAMMGLLLLMTFSSAQAQSSGKLEVSVPFAFQVGSQTLPAGDYTIRRLTQNAVVIESADGATRVVAQASVRIQLNANQRNPQEKVVFDKYGDQYFLAQIWAAKDSDGRALNKTNAERQAEREQKIAKNGAKRETIEVVASVR